MSEMKRRALGKWANGRAECRVGTEAPADRRWVPSANCEVPIAKCQLRSANCQMAGQGSEGDRKGGLMHIRNNGHKLKRVSRTNGAGAVRTGMSKTYELRLRKTGLFGWVRRSSTSALPSWRVEGGRKDMIASI